VRAAATEVAKRIEGLRLPWEDIAGAAFVLRGTVKAPSEEIAKLKEAKRDGCVRVRLAPVAYAKGESAREAWSARRTVRLAELDRDEFLRADGARGRRVPHRGGGAAGASREVRTNKRGHGGPLGPRASKESGRGCAGSMDSGRRPP
jgi:hypothetical protein